jgi:DNA-binding beta-propeller fold protein YncE
MIAPGSSTVTATISGFTNPFGIAVASNGTIYVTNVGGTTVSVLT